MGKQLRMRRVFRNGRVMVMPFDHPIYFGPQPGNEDPARVVALAREHGCTALLVTAGALRCAMDEVGDMGIIMRIDTTITKIGGPDTVMHLLHSVEEAAVLGADMVVINCYVGIGDPQLESALLAKLADASAECEAIGIPMCAEIIPRVPHEPSTINHQPFSPTSDDLAVAIRIGLEYGCDMVKTVYNGDPEGYARAIASGHLPVIMAGGPKSGDDLSIFHQLKEAMTHGACGAAIGRRVWGSERPEATLDALRAIIMDDASVDEAIRIYRGS
jgi:DhnA family fructose-bisphosphate aldolase class Ia